MAVTQNSYVGDGSTTTYSFTFPYLKTSEIKASLDATVTTAFTTPTATTVQFNTAPASGAKIKIYRETDSDSLTATFYAGSAIKSEDLNDNFTQNLYATQEVTARYLSNLGGNMVGDLQLGEDVVIKFEGATDNDYETTLTVVDPTADRTITLPNVTGTVVTTGDTGTVTSTMIANETIVSGDIANGTIVNADINASAAIAGTKISPDFGSQNVSTTGTLASGAATVTGNITVSGTVDGRDVATDGTKLDGIETAATADQTAAEIRTLVESATDSNVFTDDDHTKLNAIEASATADQTAAEIRTLVDSATDSNVFTDADHTKLNGIETAATADQTASEIKTLIASSPLDASHLAANSVTTSEIADAELTTLAGMPSGTASILADSTALTSTTTELNQLDGKTLGETTLTTNSDTAIPTSKAVNDRILTVTNALGGFVAIANETSFPATHPDPSDGAGTVVSVSDAGGVVVNGSGVASITNGAGSGNTVTINGFPSSLYSKTLGAGIGLQVQTTTTLHTYDYHKILAKEADVEQLSGDINDFNERYRVAGSAPGSNNDDGDLWFDTSAKKMKVYNATTSAWDDVASVGNFFINTISSSSGTGGGSATFNGSAYRFTLSNPPTMAQQLIVSVNGVIQKPDAGSSQPSEGFAISGNDIIFSAAPASGSDYFIITQGSSVSIGTPSDNTVSTAKIQNQAVTTAKITDANVTNAKIADDTIAEVKLDVHNAPATGKYLKYTSNGMEWSDGASEGTDVKSTGESGTTKFLRTDGDGTSSWQVPPDTVYTHPNHSGEVTSSADGAQTIADDVVDEANLKISNAGTNGQFLQKQSGNTGGLTWADAGGGVDSDSQQNTVGGTNAGDSFTGTDANDNTLFGYDAGTAITSGDTNVCIGSEAGKSLTTANQSVAIGYKALKSCTTATKNIAIGQTSQENVTGTNNIGIGYNSAQNASNASYTRNIAIGVNSMQESTTANYNTCVGDQAGRYLTTGTYNVFVGTGVGAGTYDVSSNSWYKATGSGNVVVGSGQFTGGGGADVSGSWNTALGYNAGYKHTSATESTCVGSFAGYDVTTGSNNLLLGNDAGRSNSPTGSVSTTSNYCCLGNNNIDTVYSAGSYYVPSDKRDKTDVANFTYGLSWIKKLNPVTYRWDKRTWYHEYDENGNIKTEGTPDGTKKRPKKHIGFLAQDVLEIEQADGFASDKNNMLVVNINADDTAYSVAYEKLVPVLVNAIKELSTKVETLETKVASLEAK